MYLILECSGVYYFQSAIKGIGRAGRDVVGKFALRTEAAISPSAGSQADNLHRMAGSVIECKRNRLRLPNQTVRKFTLRPVHSQPYIILSTEILPRSRAEQPQSAQNQTSGPQSSTNDYHGLVTTSPPARVDNAGSTLSAA